MRRRVSNKSHEKYRVYLSLLLKFTRNSTCELSFPLDSMNPCHDFADTVVAKTANQTTSLAINLI